MRQFMSLFTEVTNLDYLSPVTLLYGKTITSFFGDDLSFLGLLGRKHLMDSASLRLWLFCVMGEKGLKC